MPSSPLQADALLQGAEWINRVPTSERDVDVYARAGSLWGHLQGVAAYGDLPEVPESVVPFDGYLVPMGLSIRETNGVIPDAHPNHPGVGRIIRVCRWQVTMCGEVVYGGAASSSRQGILVAAGVMERLVEQMERERVRWWDPRNWQGRAVWYQGVAARVMDVRPQDGKMLLVPELLEGDEPYLDFPPEPVEAESGAEIPRRFGGIYVDILDPSVGWRRERPFTEGREQDTPATQSDTVVVSSGGDPSGGPEPTSHPVEQGTETPPGPDRDGVGEGPSDGDDIRSEVDDGRPQDDEAGEGATAAQ